MYGKIKSVERPTLSTEKMVYGIVAFRKSSLDTLPELSLLLLGRHLDHPGLVDDARRPLSLLHNADDPGLEKDLYATYALESVQVD